MGPKGNRAAVAKLRTIGEILKDADQNRSIPDVLRKKLISAGLTDLERNTEWVEVRSEEEPPTPPLEELSVEDDQTPEACEVAEGEGFSIELKADNPREGSREVSPERTGEEEYTVLSEFEGSEEASTNNKEVAGGWGLLWCINGKEMHVVEYFGEDSPWKDEVDNEGDVIMAMRCGACRDGGRVTRRNFFVDAHEVDEEDREAFKRLRPWMFEKMGPREVAEAERGKPVAIAQRGEGLAIVDGETIVKRLRRQGGRVRSVNMERYEKGERHGLLENWLSGGLI